MDVRKRIAVKPVSDQRASHECEIVVNGRVQRGLVVSAGPSVWTGASSDGAGVKRPVRVSV
jgi:hypothetical protein